MLQLKVRAETQWGMEESVAETGGPRPTPARTCVSSQRDTSHWRAQSCAVGMIVAASFWIKNSFWARPLPVGPGPHRCLLVTLRLTLPFYTCAMPSEDVGACDSCPEELQQKNKCLRLSQPGASSVGLSVNSVGPWLSHTPGAPVTSPLTQSGTLGISSFPVSSEVVHPRLSLQKNPISDYKIRNCGRYIIVYWAPSWSRNSFCRPSASYIFRAWYTLSPP